MNRTLTQMIFRLLFCSDFFVWVCFRNTQQSKMASSRLEKIGNIYTRVKGLLRSGAMKPEDRPLWYDVYEAFPPKIEPQFGRKAPDITIRSIFYPEDIIRAKFYQKFGSPGVISLSEGRYQTACQKFVEKYQEMEKDFTDEDELFNAVAKILEDEKLTLQETRDNQSDNTSDSMANMFTSAKKPSKISIQDILTDSK